MGKEEYSVYYKDKKYWRFHGTYTKTDALGTANLIKDFILGLSTYSYGIIGEEIDNIEFDWSGDIEPIEIVRGFVE